MCQTITVPLSRSRRSASASFLQPWEAVLLQGKRQFLCGSCLSHRLIGEVRPPPTTPPPPPTPRPQPRPNPRCEVRASANFCVVAVYRIPPPHTPPTTPPQPSTPPARQPAPPMRLVFCLWCIMGSHLRIVFFVLLNQIYYYRFLHAFRILYMFPHFSHSFAHFFTFFFTFFKKVFFHFTFFTVVFMVFP